MPLYTDVSPRSALNFRTVRGFPIQDANMGAPVTESDLQPGALFPPRRVRDRYDRLLAYDKLFHGDFSDHVVDATTLEILINYCERIPSVITSILMTSDPDVPEEDLQALRTLLSDAAINALVYGRAYMIRRGDEIASPPSLEMFDDDLGGVWHASSFTTAESDGRPNMIEIVQYDEDTAATRIWEWTNEGQLGSPQGETTDEGSFAIVDRPPARNYWGRSLLDLIGPTAVAMALRYSGTFRTITQNEHPLLVVTMNRQDATVVDLALPGQFDAGNYQTIANNLKAMRDHDVAWLPDGVDEPKYVEWGAAAMESSFQLLGGLAEEMSMMTGLPRALVAGGDEMPSGVALKRLLFVLYATTKQLHNLLHQAAQDVYGAEFEWPNPFEEDEEMGMEEENPLAEEDDDAEPDA